MTSTSDADSNEISDDDDDTMSASAPFYVRITASIFRRRCDLAIVCARGTVHLRLRRDGPPTIKYGFTFDPAMLARINAPVTRPRTLLSLRVHAQDAARLPFDCLVYMCRAPRPYVLRRRLVFAAHDEELVADGRASFDEERSLAFCSLDATGFDATAVPTRRTRDGEGVLVSRRYPYAYLLREVVMARELASLDALTRKCVHRSDLVTAPLEGSEDFLFPDARAFAAAVTYIAKTLVPHTQRVVDEKRLVFGVAPFDASGWKAAFDAVGRRSARASLRVSMYFVT